MAATTASVKSTPYWQETDGMQSSPFETVGQVDKLQNECRLFVEPHLDAAFRLLALVQPAADSVLEVVHESVAKGESALAPASLESRANLDSLDCRLGMDAYFQAVSPILQSLMQQACAAAPHSAEHARKILLEITGK